jgi:hypothetical protein
MHRRIRNVYWVINLAYLAAYICVFSIQYAHPPEVPNYPYTYLFLTASLSYPVWLALSRSGAGFWKGLQAVVLIPTTAELFEWGLYLFRTNGFQSRDFETVSWFGFYLLGPIGAAIAWYPIGYLAAWLLFRRNKVQTEPMSRLGDE